MSKFKKIQTNHRFFNWFVDGLKAKSDETGKSMTQLLEESTCKVQKIKRPKE